MLKVLIFILFAIGKHCNRNQQLSDSKQANPPRVKDRTSLYIDQDGDTCFCIITHLKPGKQIRDKECV